VNKLQYLAAQVGEKVLYSTQSFVTALARDLGQSILDPRGKIVVAASSAPIHTMVAEEAIKGLETRFHGDYQPGDFIVANDPYIVRGGHLPDWNFIRPLFYGSEHLGFFQAKTHVSDTGGFLPGGYGAGAYDIIAEGLNIPPMKIIRAGVLQEDLWNLVLRNAHAHQARHGHAADQRLHGARRGRWSRCHATSMASRPSRPAWPRSSPPARAMRAEIRRIPLGPYHGESATDWDGQTDRKIFVRVKAVVGDDETDLRFLRQRSAGDLHQLPCRRHDHQRDGRAVLPGRFQRAEERRRAESDPLRDAGGHGGQSALPGHRRRLADFRGNADRRGLHAGHRQGAAGARDGRLVQAPVPDQHRHAARRDRPAHQARAQLLHRDLRQRRRRRCGAGP
jgi:hypothetical protein